MIFDRLSYYLTFRHKYFCMLTADFLVHHYALEPHPEGGWYRPTYRSNEIIPADCLPGRFGGDRLFSTAIYFLLEQGNFSAFHRIKSDECWHFYTGDALEIYILQPGGTLETVTLGSAIEKGERFQYVVPAGCWFASRPAANSAFSFVGCTVAPGFDFADFEMADAATLSQAYPGQETLIQSLCR